MPAWKSGATRSVMSDPWRAKRGRSRNLDVSHSTHPPFLPKIILDKPGAIPHKDRHKSDNLPTIQADTVSSTPQPLNILEPEPSAIPSQRRTIIDDAGAAHALGWAARVIEGRLRRRARAMPLGGKLGVNGDVASRNVVENQQVRHSRSRLQIGILHIGAWGLRRILLPTQGFGQRVEGSSRAEEPNAP